MSPTIAEVRVPIKLDRDRHLVFDANTMLKYEEISKKSYFDTLTKLFEARDLHTVPVDKEDLSKGYKTRWLDVLKSVDIADIIDFVYAALHEYDANDDPHWDMSRNKVAKSIRGFSITGIVPLLLEGHLMNSPTKKELGESAPVPPPSPVVVLTPKDSTPAKEESNSGDISTEKLAAAFV